MEGNMRLKDFIKMLDFLDKEIGNVEVKRSRVEDRWVIEVLVESPKK